MNPKIIKNVIMGNNPSVTNCRKQASRNEVSRSNPLRLRWGDSLESTEKDRMINVITRIEGEMNRLAITVGYTFKGTSEEASLSPSDIAQTSFDDLVSDIKGYIKAVKELD